MLKCRRSVRFPIFFLLFCVLISLFEGANAEDKYADLDGTWYQASPSDLKKELSGYFKKAEIPKIEGRIVAVISPHAGFSYSGIVAAHAFNAMKTRMPSTVMVVGFTHRQYFPGVISVFTGEAFVTPLGRAETDIEVVNDLLLSNPAIQSIPEAFDDENSIEMLLPLGQTALPNAKFVLITLCDQSIETADILADALYGVLNSDDDVMVVASTDMCHFLEQRETVAIDSGTISKIGEMDPAAFYQYSLDHNNELMCGQGVVYAVMKASVLMGANSFKVLKYATSGDVSADKSRVVGYLSAAFVEAGEKPSQEISQKEESGMFNGSERKKLLKIARDAIGFYLSHGKKADIEESDDNLKAELGGFVTLRQGGHLRGCIGLMEAEGPFYRTVMEMAVSAAVSDPRFPPVRIEDMEDISIEISALSPMRKIVDPSEIVMGKHGVMIRMGTKSGVYLPQVATETGWSREEFMDSLCTDKAGIPVDAWRTGAADIYIYSAEVFGEEAE